MLSREEIWLQAYTATIVAQGGSNRTIKESASQADSCLAVFDKTFPDYFSANATIANAKTVSISNMLVNPHLARREAY